MSPNELEQLADEVESLQDFNYEMMDVLRSKLVWIIKYCGKGVDTVPAYIAFLIHSVYQESERATMISNLWTSCGSNKSQRPKILLLSSPY
jgi:hypothetical protein